MLLHSLFLFVLPVVLCHREHKVHNIVLYPDKQSWCKTTPIKQVVAEPGYDSVTVENSVCVGTCFSYSVPHTADITITPYCDSCQPFETHWYHVTLRRNLESEDDRIRDFNTPLPDKLQKRIQLITNCTCLSCTEQLNSYKNQEHVKINTTELPDHLFVDREKNSANNDDKTDDEKKTAYEKYETELPSSNYELSLVNHTQPLEVPELLQLVNRTNRSKNVAGRSMSNFSQVLFQANPNGENVTDAQRFYLNSKLINLLKNIQDSNINDTTPTQNNFNYDKELLKELLDIIEGSEHKLSDENLMDFVNFVNIHNSEDFELDLSRLKQVLIKFEHKTDDLREKHRRYGLGPHSDGSIEYNSNMNSEIDLIDNSTPRDIVEGSHLGMGHLKGAHIGMGIVETKPAETKKHFSGEEIEVKVENGIRHHGHLINGPHGSFAVDVDAVKFPKKHLGHKIEEKLNVEPHLLRPNHEGMVIHYESHVKDKHRVMKDEN